MRTLIVNFLIMSSVLFANALRYEDSPYLQQHANNPVNWYPWGKKALQKAKKENKLIFLSIGYSTCHWCHVMEHESFENEKTAAIMNKDYISIKVDREEYPNIDKYYQSIFTLMNGRGGGWPLTVIMNPDAKVFFTATYIPGISKYGQKGLPQVLQELVLFYKKHKKDLDANAQEIEEISKQIYRTSKQQDTVTFLPKLSETFVSEIKGRYDSVYKGIGNAPKFPQASSIQTLLEIAMLTGNADAKKMALETLDAMEMGGINDQVEGGFFRYSVDAGWMIPHFEKMLYTNAELIECYAKAYEMTHHLAYKKVIDQTVENLFKRFEYHNLFYSASDADSQGEEGKYFVFDYDEVAKALKKAKFSTEEQQKAMRYLHISKEGNFDGHKNQPYREKAPKYNKLKEVKQVLRTLRAKRKYPFIDKKVQTSWNALLIRALFKAGKIKQAQISLDALLKNLYINKVLYHQILIGKKPKVKGYLEDYAFLASALIVAYDETLDTRYLTLADRLVTQGLHTFYKDNHWFMSDDTFKSPADVYDASYRSAVSVMLENILKLAILHEDYDAYQKGIQILSLEAKSINASPISYAYATKVALMTQYPSIIIQGKKEALLKHKKELNALGYPFISIKESAINGYNACTIKECFASDTDFQSLLKKIQDYLKR